MAVTDGSGDAKTADDQSWVGWWRAEPGGRWAAVVGAETWERCWDELIRYRPPGRPMAGKAVLPAGRRP